MGAPKGTEDAKQASTNGMPLASGNKLPKKSTSRKSSRK